MLLIVLEHKLVSNCKIRIGIEYRILSNDFDERKY